MKGSDYIVEFLISKGITDVFGYPGGMVTHLMDSFDKYKDHIKAHVTYHEQGAAFAACAYAQITGRPGMAYATSGPGATNLITGICNAYFDSVPVILITGQVNTNESKHGMRVRQRGFQETDIISMVKGITKYAVYVDDISDIGACLEMAYQKAMTGRRGPVLLDIPMNIQRRDIPKEFNTEYVEDVNNNPLNIETECKRLVELISQSKRPCIVAGAALKDQKKKKLFRKLIDDFRIPVVTSMLAIDVLGSEHPLNFGFIGAYGNRTANFIVAKSDLIIAMGTRLDIRQVGANREEFAPNAQIVRIDIDEGELSYYIRPDEVDICADIEAVLRCLVGYKEGLYDKNEWIKVCDTIKQLLTSSDGTKPNDLMRKISEFVPDNIIITTDVGQNQVWTAQSFLVKSGQQVLFSGGHGAMGYSLPAAIGAYYAEKKPVVCITGDGGFQMNMQELELISRERLPIKMIVFNNHALGMIRHFQEMFFAGNHVQTTEAGGYGVPNLRKIADVYDLEYHVYRGVDEIDKDFWMNDNAALIEIEINENTYVVPKLRFGCPNQDQEPLIDRTLYKLIMEM